MAGSWRPRRQGLSPRVRGNPDVRTTRPTAPGSIPACAGEPGRYLQLGGLPPVYPRVCGGTWIATSTRLTRRGLSPRVRGNRRRHGGDRSRIRSIPACAGEPQPGSRRCPPPAVYPRVCGGTAFGALKTDVLEGLSPRVRGNPSTQLFTCPASRSIPACAGEPLDDSDSTEPFKVYPRVCGGTLKRRRRRLKRQGLSPRVRGNPYPCVPVPARVWSIPACAGEPVPVRTRARPRMVYPRVCGGTAAEQLADTELEGLSPRVRGNLVGGEGGAEGGRSIPACAGEPRPAASIHPRTGVYPRVCGGTSASMNAAHSWKGLSPRVRGNPSLPHL